MSQRQLPLPFAAAQSYDPADFVEAPSNEAARRWLARPAEWSNGRLVLWGPPGCGKSLLVRIWAAQSNATVLDGAALPALPPPVAGPVAVDDADAADEAALLHWLNATAAAGMKTVLTARQPPARFGTRLPDLGSRLRASEAVAVGQAEDELLAALLVRLAAARQLTLGLPVQNFLLTRLDRTPAALAEAVARLDRAALGRGQAITRPLAAAILADLVAETAVHGDRVT